MTGAPRRLGMLLKGYPRISESFISTEMLLLEDLGVPIEIFSLRQPRESFSHAHVKRIRAPVTYLPEYILPNLGAVLRENARLARRLGARYGQVLAGALSRAVDRRKPATVRHFLQAGCLAQTRLLGGGVAHIHAHFAHTPTSVAYFASELTGIPFSFTAHAKDIYTSEPGQLRRKIAAARFVVTCTGYNARYLRGLGVPGTPIHTIYHGIDLADFTLGPPPPPGPPYEILSVGRMVPKKGYDDLLAALSLLAASGLDFRFTHIGSGECEDEMARLAGALGLSGRVRMLGTLPREEVLSHYRRAHCFALACKVAANGDRDGIPNVIAEAMAVGLPVVTTGVSAIPELVEDGLTGHVAPPESPAAFASALLCALLRPDGAMRARAREKIEGCFDNRRCVAQLCALLREALEGP